MPNPIVLAFQALGQEKVLSAYRTITSGARTLGRDLKTVGDGGGKGLREIEDAARRASSEVSKIGHDTTGMVNLESRAKGVVDVFREAERSTENLNQVIEKTRNWGASIALAGGAGVLLSNKLVDVAEEGARADAKLEAMAKKRGEGGRIEELSEWASKLSMDAAMVDDDPIKEAAAGLLGFGVNAEQVKAIMPGLIGQARLYNQSLDATTMAFGKAFASGNVGVLKKSGVVITDADVQYIKDAGTEAERSARTFEVVKRSMDQYALGITEGMSESEMAANRMANTMDGAMTAVGDGSRRAQTNINNLAGTIVAWGTSSREAAATAGELLTYGSYLASGVGGIVAFAAQLAQAVIGYQALKAARAASTATTVADTAAQAANAAATTAAGNAAGGAAIKVGLLKTAQVAGVTAIGVAGGIALGALLYKFEQLLGLQDKNVSMMESMRRGWIALTQGVDEAQATIGDRMYEANKQQIVRNAAQMRRDGRSEADIEAYKQRATEALESHWEKEFSREGFTDRAAERSEELGRLRRQREAQEKMSSLSVSIAGPVMPASIPAADDISEDAVSPVSVPFSGPGTGILRETDAFADIMPKAPTGPSGGGHSSEEIKAAIDRISQAKKGAKNPTQKASYDAQLRSLKAAYSSSKHREGVARTESASNAKANSNAVAQRMGSQIDDIRDALDERKEDLQDLQDRLDDELDAIKKAVKEKRLGTERAAAMTEALRDAYQQREQAEEHAAQARIERINAEMIMAQADAAATAKTGVERENILREAADKRDRALKNALREERRALKSSSKEREANAAFEAAGRIAAAGGGLFSGFAKNTTSQFGRSLQGTPFDAYSNIRQKIVEAIPAGMTSAGDREYTVKLVVPATPVERAFS